MKSIFIFLLMNIFVLTTFATDQIRDRVIYKGKDYGLHIFPLEPYFEKNPWKSPVGVAISISSATRRGYVATFEFKEGHLFLKDYNLEIRDTVSRELRWKSFLSDVFPKKETLNLDWFTGLFVLIDGEMDLEENRKYIVLEIEKGEIKKEKQFNFKDYEKFKKRQFKAFKKTKEYDRVKTEWLKKGQTAKETDLFLRYFIDEFTTKFLVE